MSIHAGLLNLISTYQHLWFRFSKKLVVKQQCGDADIIATGGAENMSQGAIILPVGAPHGRFKSR